MKKKSKMWCAHVPKIIKCRIYVSVITIFGGWNVLSPYGECESRFMEMIGIVVSMEQEDDIKDKLYEAGWGGRKACILGKIS